MNPPMAFSPEVEDARAQGSPIVALESTIISHGLPRPRALKVAQAIEAAVRDAGAVPATIAVFDGVIHVGLSAAQLERLATQADLMKLSRADLALCLAQGQSGATTVAATMIAAHLAGIAVFATGGIGGVHQGASRSFDVSADLHELARTPVTVVAAGAKAILDLPATLEVLETLGVAVIAYRQRAFPAFWSRAAQGLKAPIRLDSPDEIAAAHRMRARLGLSGGQFVANPIPAASEIPHAELAPLIARVQDEAAAQQIRGKDVTPFLLQRLFELTGGRTLEANVALVLSNARLGAEIARGLAQPASEH